MLPFSSQQFHKEEALVFTIPHHLEWSEFSTHLFTPPEYPVMSTVFMTKATLKGIVSRMYAKLMVNNIAMMERI